MESPKSQLGKFEIYDHNPFPVLSVGVKKIGYPERVISRTSGDTGEMVEERQASTEKVVPNDELRYIKLFHEGLDSIATLKQRGMTMLIYVASILKPGNNAIELRRPDIAAKFPSLAGPGFYYGVTELLNAGILARKKGYAHEYFVNPNTIFTGDRIKLVKQAKKRAKITR